MQLSDDLGVVRGGRCCQALDSGTARQLREFEPVGGYSKGTDELVEVVSVVDQQDPRWLVTDHPKCVQSIRWDSYESPRLGD